MRRGVVFRLSKLPRNEPSLRHIALLPLAEHSSLGSRTPFTHSVETRHFHDEGEQRDSCPSRVWSCDNMDASQSLTRGLMSEELNVLRNARRSHARSLWLQTLAPASVDRSRHTPRSFPSAPRFTLNPNSVSAKRSIDQIKGSFLLFRFAQRDDDASRE